MNDRADDFAMRWKELAGAFLKLGAMSCGGPAIMGIMQAEIQEKRGWLSKERFLEGLALVNMLLGVVGGWFGNPELTFEQILGYVFAPIMTVIGVPWAEATSAGSFVGQKAVVNEFVAFSNFVPMIEEFSPKTAAIVTFALTGFANLGSLGILLGGLGGLVRHRRREIAELGLRAIAAGTLANLMSATIAGILIG